jgi:UDP-2,3-diacylglucosamine hydrolase
MVLQPGKKIYFASDFHLGVPDLAASHERERRICRWLDEIRPDAQRIYLVGDIFDAWFEYRYVVPKGFVRLMGKLAELTDAGIEIEAFTGNHDLWMRGYFEDELNIPVHHGPVELEVNGKKLFIAHGDGLGPGDHKYKLLKRILTNPACQWLYRRFHPNFGIGVASFFSKLGPKHKNTEPEKFLGEDKEWLIRFCKDTLKEQHFDYFIFGHRHLPLEYPVGEGSTYINLGDWITFNTFGVFDGHTCSLQRYEQAAG